MMEMDDVVRWYDGTMVGNLNAIQLIDDLHLQSIFFEKAPFSLYLETAYQKLQKL